MAENASEPRDRRLGRYELVSHLATGGMGDVHLARMAGPAGFQRWVVVKVLLPELAPSARYRDMFLAEARLAARLAHPNVCEVLDLGEEGGTYYIVMPYLDGVPLAAVMKRPVDADAAWYRRLVVGVIAQACEGLHHAHQLAHDDGASLGVVHRDVSPSNVMVLRDGVVKVLDFGIAKSRASEQVTEKDVIKGKPAYMAPEQLAGGSIDRRADVFCVGILLWEALAQRPLFQRASSIMSARAVLEDEAPGLAADGVSPALAAVVAKALAKEPYRRQATADALRAELVAAFASDGEAVMTAAEIAAAVTGHWADRLRPPPGASPGATAGTAPSSAVSGEAATLAVTPRTVSARRGAGTEAAGSQAATMEVARGGEDARTTVTARRVGVRAVVLAGVVAAAAGGIAVYALGSRGSRGDAGTGVGTDAAAVARIDVSGMDAGGASGGVDAGDLGAGREVDARAGGGSTGSANAGSATAGGSATGAGSTTGAGSATAAGNAGGGSTGGGRHVKPTGLLSIDSTPWATIYVDGKRLGITPLIDRPVKAGAHTVRAVTEDGRAQERQVVIEPGAKQTPIRLHW